MRSISGGSWALLGFVAGLIVGGAVLSMQKPGKPLSSKPEAVVEALPLPPEATPLAWTTLELRCLAQTVWGESRGEPYSGQLAVAAVVVSRSLDPRWKSQLCDLVAEPAQFAGYWTGQRMPMFSPETALAYQAALHATSGYWELPEQYRKPLFFTGKNDISPFHQRLTELWSIGGHVFFGDRQ